MADGSTDGVKQLNLTGNMQFILDNPDFESQRLAHPERKGYLGITKSDDEYVIYSGQNDTNVVRASFTKDELRIIWTILTDTHPNRSAPKDLEYAKTIIRNACEFYHIKPEELSLRNRKASVIRLRKLIATVLRNYTYTTLWDVAFLLGYKVHRTVYYHVQNTERELSDTVYGDIEIKYEYNQLLNFLNLKDHDKKTTKANGH